MINSSIRTKPPSPVKSYGTSTGWTLGQGSWKMYPYLPWGVAGGVVEGEEGGEVEEGDIGGEMMMRIVRDGQSQGLGGKKKNFTDFCSRFTFVFNVHAK